MPKNVIVLSPGQSGSSVLTALIARAGLWCGDETTDVGYNTYENAELVQLNRELLRVSGIKWDSPSQEAGPAIERLRARVREADNRDAQSFVQKCAAHVPWIWKDPRLCYTMHYWEAFLNVADCQFVIMNRDWRQAWSGHMIKGKPPVSLADFAKVQVRAGEAAQSYVSDRGLPHFVTTFEELTVEPTRVLSALNEFLGTSLTLGDLRETYRDPLGKLRWSKVDYAQAWGRFLVHRWILRDVDPAKLRDDGSG